MTNFRVASVAVLLLSGVVYWATAYPTITWWDSSSYSLAAATLGITSPPGSILLTLLGWPVTQVARMVGPEHVARALNLFAGVLAASTAALVLVCAVALQRTAHTPTLNANRSPMLLGAAIGALTSALSATLWEHAIKFTPYVLTALFTTLILLVLLRYWRDADRADAWRWIFLLTLLFGIDFSVHRTNALLIPGAVVWIAIRSPRTLISPRSVGAAVAGMALGLLVQLLVMLVSANTHSPVNFFPPDTLQRFWEYVSLKNAGGNFLLGIWPRKSPIFDVQLRDLLSILRATVLPGGVASVIGVVPLALAVAGLIAVFVRNRRLGTALGLFVVLHAITTVLYFNIPADFFRPFDRHYLPVLVVVGVLMATGAGVLFERASSIVNRPRRLVFTALAALCGIVAPVAQLQANWHAHDASRRWFARDYAVNALEGLPPNAIYFTVGDNDTFPVMYVQAVEGVRPDVTILNLSLANTEWFLAQLQARDTTFQLTMSVEQRAAALKASWKDSVVVAPGPTGELRLVPRSAYGDMWLTADVVMVDLVRTNAWRRPLAFASTMGENGPGWLMPLAQREGLHWVVWPRAADASYERLGYNMLERYRYRGYADSSIALEPESRTMAVMYLAGFRELLAVEAARDARRCRAVSDTVFQLFPPERLELPVEMYGSALSC